LQTPPPADSERRQGLRYQRLLPLGSGGMAHVHLSLAIGHSGFKRLVVVKSVRDELVADATMRQMFLAEARLSARLNHPNVVQVSEIVETEGGVMLVMEYLDGLALSAACRAAGEAFTLGMRLRVMCDVLSGLAYAHDLVDYDGQPLGVVHRDVSAQNVLVTFDGRVKLLDFGIAKVTSAPDRTRTGVIKGRIAYMPVEQVTGKTVDRRTDVYAVGCLLWEAIASSKIWGDLSEPQIIRNVLKGGVPALSSRVQVHPELERIVSKATAQMPDDRYATADELRLDLETFSRTLPPVTLREIGELLSAVSSEARAERKRELAIAIANAERELASQGVDLDGQSRVIRTSGGDDGDTQVSSASRPRPVRSMSPTPRPYAISATPPATEQSHSASFTGALRPRRTGLWIALALASALVVVAWGPKLRRGPSGPAAAGAPLRPPAMVPATPVASAPEARPDLGSSPGTHEESSDTAPVASTSAASKSRRAPVRVLAPSAPPAVATPKASARAGCNPPYYFAAGIKTYKPECI